jgi:large subunit ribosomal protein L28
MASCQMCAKSNQVGNSISHAQNKNKRRIKANIQKVTFLNNDQPKTMRVCTQCMKKIV